MQLRIGDWAAFSAHSCLPKAPIGFEEPIITLALNDILLRGGAGRCRVSRQSDGCRQAGSQENQTGSSFEVHDKRLQTMGFGTRNIREGFPSPRHYVAHGKYNLLSSIQLRGRGRRRHPAGGVLSNRAAIVARPAGMRGDSG